MPLPNRLFLTAAIVISMLSFESCGSAETKADVSDTLKTNTGSQPVPEEAENTGPASRSVSVAEPAGDKAAILRNIDSYLVSRVAYPEPGTITVENKLPDIMVQKAIAEVVFTKENGDTAKTDFYILENIEPGGSKSAKIAAGPQGTKASAHILKLKSDDLTGGELIMVGNKYSPN